MRREPFGALPDGRAVEVFTLTSARGMEVRFMSYGGIVLSIRVPDRTGALADVALGFDSLDGYLGEHPWFGALIGRYANRIARGRFTVDGREYVLPLNDGPNHLHGGPGGFDRRLWEVEPFVGDGRTGAVLSYTSVAREEGYPGTLSVRVTYTLTDENELVFDYHATTDAPTPVNLTQHPYFNLAGQGAGDVTRHVLTLHASYYTPVDATLIPTGEVRSVLDTPFDFTSPTPVGARIDQDDEQLGITGGYDHNFVLDQRSTIPSLAAQLYEPESGRLLEVLTTEPGIQFYSGNSLAGRFVGKEGRVYRRRSGLALEAQHFPDSPNHPDFPSTILRPGEEYRSRTVYRFSVR